ncbi:MAG: hypothetical protein ABI862_01205 [Ilumatobacteraceae bacterium]
MSTPRRLAWAMHAFPRRFRAQRSAEIEATFHEADLAGDRNAYGPKALIDVVLAGWGERTRTRPPIGRYLKYRLVGGRLEPRWHAWMFDDLDGWFPLRRAAWTGIPILVIVAAAWRASGGLMPLPPPVFWLVWAIAMGLGARLDRRRTLTRHGYDPRTRTWVPPPIVVRWVPIPRRIRRAVPMLVGIAAALLVVTPFAAITLLLPGRSVRSVTIGSFSFERIVDHTVGVGWGAVAVGSVGLFVGIAKHRWIAARTLAPAAVVDPTAFVVVPAGPLAWIVPASVLVVGIVTSLLPLAPLVVPAAFLAAGCASPGLLVLARTARELERAGSGEVGLSTASHTAQPRRVPR